MSTKGITVRFLLSVAAGLAKSMALSVITRGILYLAGIFPAPFKPLFDNQLVAGALIYHSVFALTGAFVTAHVARNRARRAVIFLGSKEAIMWLLGTIFLWKHAPVWYTISKALMGIPIALLGGYLYQRSRQASGRTAPPDESMLLKDLIARVFSRLSKKHRHVV